MEEDLRALLLAAPGVTALCSSRIDWGRRPQGAAFPAIALNVISHPRAYTMAGQDTLSQARVQVDCFDVTYGGAKLLGRAVLAALSGYRGGKFQGIFCDGEQDLEDSGKDMPEYPFRSSFDFIVNHDDS